MYSAEVSTPSSRISTETPSHVVPNFDHLVTQWMSFVISSEGNCLNSSHVHLVGSSISPTMEKSHSSSGVWGVGPAESTGKPSSRYCPGGSAVSWLLLRRPKKPREMKPSLMFYTSLLPSFNGRRSAVRDSYHETGMASLERKRPPPQDPGAHPATPLQ